MTKTGVPGTAVAVVYKDTVVYERGFGVRKLGEPEKITPDTVFQIASLSKSLSSTLVAALVGDGTTSWDATIGGIELRLCPLRSVGQRPGHHSRHALPSLWPAGLQRRPSGLLLSLRSRGVHSAPPSLSLGVFIPYHLGVFQSGVQRRRLRGGTRGGAVVGGSGRDTAVRTSRHDQHELPLCGFRAPGEPGGPALPNSGRRLGTWRPDQ